jgi:hypothetical protein
MTHALSLTEAEEKIAARIDRSTTGQLPVSDAAGGLAFADLGQVMEFAKLMAVAGIAVPKHLRGSAGACAAVCIQAVEWRMSPFAVANKSYSVNDRLAYEAQLVQAVILQRAPIKGRIKVEYHGEGERRVCRVWAELRDEPGEIVEYVSPVFARITPKNSPLWKSDPDQQQFYYAVRALCRRHFPDVLLGVYAKDELEDAPRMPRDITPPSTSLVGRIASMSGGPKPPPPPEEPEPEPEEELPPHDEDGVIEEEPPPPNFDPDTGMPYDADEPIDEASADFKRGAADRAKGIAKCLNSEIRNSPVRMRHWQAGYDSGEPA